MTSRLLPALSAAIAALTVLVSAMPSDAHFSVNSRTRVIHVSEADSGGGVKLSLRIPGPLAFAEALANRAGPTAIVEAPFVTRTDVRGQGFYILDREAIAADPDSFIRFVAEGYYIRANGIEQEAVPLRHAIYTVRNRVPFGEPAEVAEAFGSYLANNENIYVGDSLIDVEILLPDADIAATIAIASNLPEIALPPGMLLENLAIDHRFGEARTQTYTGQMQEAVTFDGSLFSALKTFVWQGIVHILLGYDHLVFVVCLVFAAGTLGRILWSVTGFTIGHSVTLSLSFLGIAPAMEWFIPAIEVGIAVSIVLTGLAILYRQKSEAAPDRATMTGLSLFALTGLVGLVHGYGFSAVLVELTGGSMRNFTMEILGFNAGIEIGQLVIVAIVFAAIRLLTWTGAAAPRLAGQAVAAGSMAIGLWWTIERIAGMV